MRIFIDSILPFLYLPAIALMLTRCSTFTRHKLPAVLILLFFISKCIAGILYSYIALKYITNRGDIWPFYEDGLELYQTLIYHPSSFVNRVQEMFTIRDIAALNSQSDIAKSAFEGIKFIQFIFNLLSFGNLYTNTILFNGLATWAFIRCWIFLKEQLQGWIAGGWLFLFPSAFFYTSGIHKEGIIFILMALLIPVCCKIVSKYSIKRCLLASLLFFLFVFFKFFVAVLFAGAMGLYWLLVKYRQRVPVIVASCVLGSIFLFFLSGWLWPAHGLPQMIIQRQKEFLEIKAASAFEPISLQPSFISFIKALPISIFNVFFRPLPGQGGNALYYVYSCEIFLFWAFVVYLFIKNKCRALFVNVPALVWALFIFACFNLLIIGYTVSNIGATMRYRSVFLPFIGLFSWYLFNGNTIANGDKVLSLVRIRKTAT